MKAGRFILSDSAICFNTENTLVNGQHRLLAVIKTGLTQPFIVIKNLPEDPNKYVIPEIPETYTADSPLMDGWRKYCHENKLGQEAFDKGINLFIDSQPQIDIEAEKRKLGENANQRIEAVSLWVNKNFDEISHGIK